MPGPYSRSWISPSREGDAYHEREGAAFERYRDTHPHVRRAMEYFNHYNRIKNQMEKEFSQKYFPLNLRLTECGEEWRWGGAPLPWEGECA